MLAHKNDGVNLRAKTFRMINRNLLPVDVSPNIMVGGFVNLLLLLTR